MCRKIDLTHSTMAVSYISKHPSDHTVSRLIVEGLHHVFLDEEI